ncbi:hypothetical protein ACLK2H_19560 [Escherichia coli]
MAFSHCANDGQEGIGLVMLVLIWSSPGWFRGQYECFRLRNSRNRDAVNNVENFFQQRPELLQKVADNAEKLTPEAMAGRWNSTVIQRIPSTRLTAPKRC